MARRLVAIDMLRGIAVLAVLADHLPFSATLGAGGATVYPEWIVAVLQRGHAGVDLFLVLSGFCIHRSAGRSTFAAFWRRRLRRLYPPYFAALVVTIAGLYALGRVTGSPVALRPVDVAVSLLLLQNITGAAARIGNAPFWSLALEEQLYLLYFPLMWLRRRYGWVATVVFVLAVTTAWRALTGDHAIGPARWFEWALGALAVEATTGDVTLPRWCYSRLLMLTALAVALWSDNDVAYGVAFFLVVNVAVSEDRASVLAHALAWVGMWSYSLYLTHAPVVVAAKAIAMRLHGGIGAVTVARIVLPLVVGYAFHVLIERHYMTATK